MTAGRDFTDTEVAAAWNAGAAAWDQFVESGADYYRQPSEYSENLSRASARSFRLAPPAQASRVAGLSPSFHPLRPSRVF
ncbi:MAG: hypothetical protein ACT4PM_10035 [Gemmatimonadales bacterium]